MAGSARHRLVFTARARADTEALDVLTRKRIGLKILALESGPLGKSTKLVNAVLGTYRFRIGDYRVIFDLDGRDVVILRVGHRREVYR